MADRTVYLESRTSLDDAGTRTVYITATEPIKAIMVELRATNGATNNQAATAIDALSRVEVIDGGRTLYSLDGEEAFANMCYEMRKIPYTLVTELPSTVQNIVVPVMFGRFWGDEEFAFDPTRFVNPQVRVQWNLAAVRAVGATGFLSGSAQLTLWLVLAQSGVRPRGMVTTKEVETWTTAASGVQYVDLPRDNPIRKILVRAAKAATAPYSVVTNVKLNCGQGAFVPIDMRMTDLIRYMSHLQSPFAYKHLFHAANGDTLYTLLKADEQVCLQNYSGDNVLGYTNNGCGEGALTALVGGAAQTSDISIAAQVEGWCPCATVEIPFGDPLDEATWFDPTRYGSVRMELTQGSASGTGAVVVQQRELYS